VVYLNDFSHFMLFMSTIIYCLQYISFSLVSSFYFVESVHFSSHFIATSIHSILTRSLLYVSCFIPHSFLIMFLYLPYNVARYFVTRLQLSHSYPASMHHVMASTLLHPPSLAHSIPFHSHSPCYLNTHACNNMVV